jgi:integrase
MERSAKMLRKDLEAAKIAYRDADGRVFDFHALRHQFISNLARGGVHPKEAQTLARHSTITLTMDRYTHLALADLTSALDRLPAIANGISARRP